nr:uncharacterized protein LOC117276725 [Nicotiana tomentosiformis]
MEKRGPQINHLSFANDIIIFTSGGRTSLQKIMRILDNYEDISGQQINRHKSHFITSPCAFPATIRRVQDVTDFTNKESPLTYLGFPLYTGRKRIVHFNDLVDKVVDRIKGKKLKTTSDRGSTLAIAASGGTTEISDIMHTPIHYRPAALDKAIWTPNVIGKFTCASAWEVIRPKKQPNLTNKLTWHKKIPFKWSFCVWRALKNKLPTDDRVLQFRSPTVTRCVYCNTPAAETADHIFSHGNFAKLVWRKYGGPTGVQTQYLTLRILLMKWWLIKRSNELHKLILDTLPIIISWNLWKNRCNAKYGAKTSSLTRVLYSIDADIHLLLCTNYPAIKWLLNRTELYGYIENIQHHTSIKKVAWSRPDTGLVKINSDGSDLTNPGQTGPGVTIRGSCGKPITQLILCQILATICQP